MTSPFKYIFTTKELADRWSLKPQTIANWRAKGTGPEFIKLGHSVRYHIEEIEKHEKISQKVV